MTSAGGILSSMKMLLKRLTSSFSEKPVLKVDEHELEHLLLYHGLVGSSPENQREFRDVQADVISALERGSSSEICIALKLPPLWWKEKLEKILSLATPLEAIPTLLPPDDSVVLSPNSDPLRHEDWRVQANAAYLLAFLQAEQAVPRLIDALNQSASESKAAFCHIALSLGCLQNDQSFKALQDHLLDSEPWFRVDAASALAEWPSEQSGEVLMQAMLSPHKLSDYMAVAIARRHQPLQFLQQDDSTLNQGALETIICVLQASRQTYTADIVLETRTHLCWPELYRLFRESKQPRVIHAALRLARWLTENKPLWFDADNGSLTEQETELQIKDLLQQLEEPAVKKSIMSMFDRLGDKPGNEDRHCLQLAGVLKLDEAVNDLCRLAEPNFAFLDEVVESLGSIGNAGASATLVRLCHQTVNLEERNNQPLSKSPVKEGDTKTARTYWLILQALGKLPHDEKSIRLLIAASGDFASDKRQQAVESLLSVDPQSLSKDLASELLSVLSRAVDDPSPPVQIAALRLVSRLGAIELLDKVMKLGDSKTPSVSRNALQTLQELSRCGHQDRVRGGLESRARHEFDPYKKQRYVDVLESLRQD